MKLSVFCCLFFTTIISTSSHLSALNQRTSSYPFISGDTFRSIADHIIDETLIPFNPKQVQPYDIIFLKTDLVPHFFETFHPHIPVNYILITHNSDLSPIFLTALDHPWSGQSMKKYLDDPKLVVWFGQNIDYVHPKLKPIPIGIANNYLQHGRVESFLQATKRMPSLDERSNRVYLNFTAATNTKERASAIHYFKEKSFSYFASPKPIEKYLEETKQYRYVISPAGNGLDCHRTWEALLLGAIPIMKHSMLDPMFDGMPVIFIDEWPEVTEDFLNKTFAAMKNKT